MAFGKRLTISSEKIARATGRPNGLTSNRLSSIDSLCYSVRFRANTGTPITNRALVHDSKYLWCGNVDFLMAQAIGSSTVCHGILALVRDVVFLPAMDAFGVRFLLCVTVSGHRIPGRYGKKIIYLDNIFAF